LPLSGFLAVGVGAALGAWLRWAFGIWLNPVFPTVPLGTLSANLLGGFIIGAVMSAADPLGFTPVVRLLVVTGFLGGLTTFSTFSAETTTLVLQARYGWALGAILMHVAGSLCMTTLGVFLIRAHLGD
jgi:fluoride exporter